MTIYLVIIKYERRYDLYRVCDNLTDAYFWAHKIEHYIKDHEIIIIKEDLELTTTTLT